MEVGSIPIIKNDILICYTDGLTEMSDEHGNHLNSDGIAAILKNNKSLAKINTSLSSLIAENRNKEGLDDDITFLAAQFL